MRLKALVLTLVVLALGTGSAWADIQVHVMNCTQGSIKAQSFDAKDSVKEVAASSKTIGAGQSATLKCAGEGKGFCQMIIVVLSPPAGTCDNTDFSSGVGGSVQFNLDSGKWAVMTGYERHKEANHNDIYICKPVVSENQDSSTCP